MRIKINATRMQLLSLKRRLVLAKRGHKLLKDKLDGLIQKFFILKDEYQDLFNKLEPKLSEIFKHAVFGYALSPQSVIDALLNSQKEISTIAAPMEILQAQKDFIGILPDLLALAEKCASLKLMAEQIIETRRRVNALEYVLVPELERACSQIKMKLSELERMGQVTLLKIKDIVRAH